jgi:superfamily II DNA or RNA helicase
MSRSNDKNSIAARSIADIYRALRDEFGDTGMARGREIAESGKVDIESVNKDDAGTWRVISNVQGTAASPYRTVVEIEVERTFVQIDSAECSCPVAINCKHAAAAMIAWFNTWPQANGLLLGAPSVSDSPQTISRDAQSVSTRNSSLREDLRDRIRSTATAVAAPTHRRSNVSLAPGLAAWLQQTANEVSEAERNESKAKKTPTQQNTLVYLLSTHGVLSIAKAKFDARHKRYALAGELASLAWIEHDRARPSYVAAQDEPLLRMIAASLGPLASEPRAHLRGKTGEQILQLALASGRTFISPPESWFRELWRKKGKGIEITEFDRPLSSGDTVAAALVWHSNNDDGKATITLRAQFNDEGATITAPIIATEPPVVLDETNAQVKRLDIALSHPSLDRLLSLPPLRADDAIAWAYVADAISALPDASQVPPCPTVVQNDVPLPTPRGVLRFGLVEFRFETGWGSAKREREIVFPGVEFILDYGHERLPYDTRGFDAAVEEERVGSATLSRRMRNVRAEQTWAMRMPPMLLPASNVERALMYSEALGADAGTGSGTGSSAGATRRSLWALPDHDWANHGATVLADAQMAGFVIEVEDGFPVSLEDIPEPSLELSPGTENGWFRMALGVTVNGERVDIAPALAKLIAAQRKVDEWLIEVKSIPFILLSVPSVNRANKAIVVRIPGERIHAILEPVFDWFRGGNVEEISGLQAALMPNLPNDTVLYLGRENPKWIAMRQAVEEGAKLEAVTPHHEFRATLRAYQLHGLSWLDHLRALSMGGILADDMGLGKTVQTLAYLHRVHRAGGSKKPSLIIAPTSVTANWVAEAKRFAPDLILHRHHGIDRSEDERDLKRADLVITSYPLLQRDEDLLAGIPWNVAVFDEAQVLKNPKAKTYQAAQRLNADMRLALTGTPMENHLGELWSIYNVLMPGLLGDLDGFNRIFRFPVELRSDAAQMKKLRMRIRPFMLRRTRDQVLNELPPKTEFTRWVEFDSPQADLYESLRTAIHDDVRKVIDKKGMKQSTIHILDALLKLRQVCCDPRLVKLPGVAERAANAGSAKLDWLLTHVPELIEEGRNILIFSQFTSMLALISKALDDLKIEYVQLTGDTIDRDTPIARFQNGDVRVFLLSLKAGGVGLNLTAADTVIHYDPWWNPAIEAQATARAHRMGQTKPVFVTKLVAKGTLEERMMVLLERKRELASALLSGDGNALTGITAEDVESLLAPISSL